MIAWVIARPRLIIGAVVVALFGGWTVISYRHGVKTERGVWAERQRVAEAAARQTERDLAALAEKSAKRITLKEQMLTERAHDHADQIRQILASVPECSVPRSVGRVLDATAGVPPVARVAEPPEPDADAPALDAVVRLADILDIVNENYSICRINVERLTEARDWYTNLRERVNKE